MFDFVVIGGGSAGYAAARTAVDQGLKTAVIDGAEELGGLCILRGCMPSKTLIETANRMRSLERATEFGIDSAGGKVDLAAVIRRKRNLIDEFASYRQGQLEDGRFELIRGQARFLNANQISVALRHGGHREVNFKTGIISSGSTIWIPEIEGLEKVGYFTSDDILFAEKLPSSVIVLGGGAIALEMAHYMAGIGIAVTVIQRSPHLLSSMDPDLGDALRGALQERGVAVHCGTKVLRVASEGGQKTVYYLQDGVEKSVTGADLFVALGRRPATTALNLAEAGVATERERVVADGAQRTSQAHLFAAGDVCGPMEVVHVAIQQGETAALNAAKHLAGDASGPVLMDYRLALYGVFTDPQVAYVGASERSLKEQGRAYKVASYPFDDHGKSMVMGETHGFVKLMADAQTGEILGGAVVGPEAVELIHEIVVAMAFRSTALQLAQVPHYHPTLSEIWTYPAEDLAEETGS